VNAAAAPLVCITGLTASGKSSLALELASMLGAEILSMDSMQVYRGFDVGTAKPSVVEQARIRHHGIDLCEPCETFSAGAFLAYARGVLQAARAEGRVVLAVGGTGLYFRALLRGLVPVPPADPELRAELRAVEAAEPGTLRRRLLELDPEAAARLHPNDLVRAERALEVRLTTGRPLSAWQAEHGFPPPPFRTLVLGIRRPRDELRARIAARVQAMLDAGWVEEVVGLLAAGVSRSCTPMKAIGYPECLAHIDGELSADDLAPTIATATWRFAKRQTTWFNREPSVQWIEAQAGLPRVLRPRIEGFLASP
jgi:tRNA dimethylallyltransferase